MNNLTINQILGADLRVSELSPVIKPGNSSFVAADPSLLTPDESPDGLWHIFFHTTFGVRHAVSKDGINFEKSEKFFGRAMRPDINRIGGRYYLFYERTRPIIFNGLNVLNLAKWKSEIYVSESEDLKQWSEPKPVITHTREYEESERGISISNPFYLCDNGISRLYYSCGLTYVEDCGFCEPTYISYAESKRADGDYVSAESPVIKPDPESIYTNICSGCLKVYKLKDGYLGIQNGIYRQDGKSKSAIMALSSRDGLNFRFEKILIEPDGNENSWMGQYVYASHLVKHGNELRLYFNARNKSDMLRGRECIGFASAEIR
ncbi:MAG: glycosyl hydrolase family 43 [Clostridia bacterium]|nr:glycosyl hydrolase family 43 [Clostridia bacterium]